MGTVESLRSTRWTLVGPAALIGAAAWMAVGCHTEAAVTPGNGAPVSATQEAKGTVATVNVPVDTKAEEPVPKKIEEEPRAPEPVEEMPREAPDEDEEPDGVVGGVPGGVVGGVVGGVIGGVLGGPPPSPPPKGPDSVWSIGDPELTQSTCPKLSGTPPYPKEARDAKVETTLIVRCIVEKSGELQCTFIKSHPLFEKPTLAFLKKQKVTPFALKDGTKVRVGCVYPFRFKLQ